MIACFLLFLFPSYPSFSSVTRRVCMFPTAQPQTFTTFSARSLLTRSCAWPTLHVPVFIRHFKVQQDTFLPLQRTALFSALKATARTILSPRHFGCFSDLFFKEKTKGTHSPSVPLHGDTFSGQNSIRNAWCSSTAVHVLSCQGDGKMSHFLHTSCWPRTLAPAPLRPGEEPQALLGAI